MSGHKPSFDRFIEIMSSLGEGQPLSEQREIYSHSSSALELSKPDGVDFYDEGLQVQGHLVPVRHYELRGVPPVALMLYFHGGGWVKGDLNSHHEVLAHMTVQTGAQIVAVDYPLAPENRHPVQLLCCYAILETLAARQRARGLQIPLVVAGDSAGGQLAAALCLLSREEHGPAIHAQVLIYPALDYLCKSESFVRYAQDQILSADTMRKYWQYVLPQGGAVTSLVSPTLERDTAGLPRALIQLAEIDVLHDEAVAYGDRLSASGVQVQMLDGSGMIHGFLRAIGMSEDARSEFDRLCLAIKNFVGQTGQ